VISLVCSSNLHNHYMWFIIPCPPYLRQSIALLPHRGSTNVTNHEESSSSPSYTKNFPSVRKNFAYYAVLPHIHLHPIPKFLRTCFLCSEKLLAAHWWRMSDGSRWTRSASGSVVLTRRLWALGLDRGRVWGSPSLWLHSVLAYSTRCSRLWHQPIGTRPELR